MVDPAGRPVERYAVGYAEAEPFPDGRFARPLPRELEEVLTVRAAGFAPLQRKYAAKRGERVDLGELQLTPARTVTGQVRDQKSGQPLAQVEVRFGFETDEALQRARSGTDGRFELVDVPREAGTLFVSHPRYRLTTVPLGATQDAVQVKLSAGLEVSGAIITRDGREARADGVSAEGPEGLRREAAVSEGRYALGSLEPGSWKLRLSGPMVSGFDVLELTLTGEGAVNADFIERAGGVAVTLLPLDDEGHPVNATGWLVPGRVAVPSTVKGADAQLSGALESEEGPDGTHGFSSVSPGVYTAVIRLRDLPMMWAESFEVHPGMASPLRLVMPRGLQPSSP
ncbi:MAG: carboxypeptidase regulatory-like domain-containing protein [Archangiaceae bacterium]|nr:carboxypeptidase regulatory-like domain-containing protein [Archangiaceae bacterium]